MIKINGNNIDTVKVNNTRISSVFVNKINTGKKYFVHYDTTIEIVNNNYTVNINIDDYAGYKLGFFMEKYQTGWFSQTKYKLKNFAEEAGGNFKVDFPNSITGIVGYILFMHPFASETTIQKYQTALESSFYDDESNFGQMMMEHNYDFLKDEGNKITTKFFEDYGIDEDTCNEECFGMVIIRDFGTINFIKKADFTG